MTVEFGWVASVASGFLYVALGVWVLTLTPRKPAALFFAAFAVSFGVYWVGGDVSALLGWANVGFLSVVAFWLSSAAILGVALTVPGPLEERRLLWVALGVSAPFLLTSAIAEASVDLGMMTGLSWVEFFSFWVGVWCHWAAGLLIAFRASPSRQADKQQVVQLGILTMGFAGVVIFWVGLFVPQTVELLALGDVAAALSIGIPVLFWLMVAGAWGLNMVQAGPSTGRVHRVTMLSVLGVMLVGAVAGAMYDVGASGGAAVNTLGVALLAYGVLRHDLAGLDAKVEWGVSKTTVAGAFVAVFFVAGELAETFFGDVLGDYIGIIAAGLLVFAISPLQRLADSIAAKAVPGGAKAGSGVEQQYLAAVEMAWADGEITTGEERHLAEKADALGLSHARAQELQQRVRGKRGGEAT